ncbi:minor tail protein [Mycobacterium phage Fowlmouth]|uniref:Minor tail protein n=1 Tax=Mycobacterium phage Fowlmouth TaxID=2419978 RepID=A0A3G2KG54_9CAUD|nr:minor tail protein [Mycobacterium phage Fowlmouth]AYN57972.1 minor tail protein [Mycobacterium phage Fowlmouth]
MAQSRNLEPGQYQLGDFVFGYGTLFSVETFDPMGYDVNVQDYQSQLSDEIRFGSDSLKPLPIQLEINAFSNRLLGNIASLTGDTRELNFENDRRIGEFTREWRADEIRGKWGELKPLHICRKDGRVVQVFGRPGKLAVSKPDREGMRKVVAEFRRSDTLYYNDFEWYLQVREGEVATVYRPYELDMGDGDSWLRFLIVGPMKNPIIQVGSITINLVHELEPGEIVEISSYPWARRAIRLNDGLSLNAKVTQPYLEKLSFPPNTPIKVSWNATDTNTQIELVDFSEEFETEEGLNPDDWTETTYQGSTDGGWKIDNGVLTWDDSGNGNRSATSIFNKPSLTPYQSVGMTLATPPEGSLLGSEECSNRIIGRSNEDGTEYLYWDLTYTKAWFGHHKDGEDTILSEIYSLPRVMNLLQTILGALFGPIFGSGLPNNNWKYDVEFGTGAGEFSSTLKINDHFGVTFTPESELEIPSANLYTGLGMRATTRALGQSTPGTVSEWHMRDNSPEPIDVSAVYMFWRDAWQNL